MLPKLKYDISMSLSSKQFKYTTKKDKNRGTEVRKMVMWKCGNRKKWYLNSRMKVINMSLCVPVHIITVMIAVICIRPEVLSINVLAAVGLWQLIVVLRVGRVLIVLASVLQSSVNSR